MDSTAPRFTLGLPEPRPPPATSTGRGARDWTLLEHLPRDQGLLETDGPYLSPDRRAENEAEKVARTLALAASLWGIPEERAADQLEENFEALFGLRP